MGETIRAGHIPLFYDYLDPVKREALFWEYPRDLEATEPLRFGFVIENHLGKNHTYSYRVVEQSPEEQRVLLYREIRVAAEQSRHITVSIPDAPQAGRQIKIAVHLDTGDETYFWVTRQEQER